MASAILPPHVPFALGSSSLLNVPRPGAPIPFPLPLPPPSAAVFLPLGSSYLPMIQPWRLFPCFLVFLGSLVWVFRHPVIRCPPPVACLSCAPTASSIHHLLQLLCSGQITSGLPSVSTDLLRTGFAAFRPLLGFFCAPTATSFHRALLCTRSAYTRSISFPVFLLLVFSYAAFLFPVFRLLFACNNALASMVLLNPL